MSKIYEIGIVAGALIIGTIGGWAAGIRIGYQEARKETPAEHFDNGRQDGLSEGLVKGIDEGYRQCTSDAERMCQEEIKTCEIGLRACLSMGEVTIDYNDVNKDGHMDTRFRHPFGNEAYCIDGNGDGAQDFILKDRNGNILEKKLGNPAVVKNKTLHL